MRFIEIPALITEDIEDPSIVEITEPITVSISGTTMTIDGGSKVSGEASVTLTGDVTVNAFTLQNVKQPSIHKISVKTGRKGNFTYVPNITVTASSVSTTTKTGSDFEILLITTTGGETYVDFDMADYVSPALYTSNALTGFDISELTSTYGATAKLYKPDGTLLTTVTSATTGNGVNFGYTESTPGDVTYTLEVEDDLGRTSRYDLPRKWISYAMETNSTPGFEKLELAGNEYTSTTIVPSISPSSKAKVFRTNNHGYMGINFKIQGRNSTNDAWTDIANADEDDEVLAFGDYLYHRVWVKPTAKATTTVSSSNVVTLTLSNLTEENVTTSFTGADPFDINESTNTYVFEETTKIGTVPYTVTLGSETYTNAVTVTTEGTAYDYVTLAFANPTLSLTTSNVTISSAKLYRDDVLFHTYGTESNVVLRSDQTGTYQAIVNDVYYSNRVVPDFTTTRSVSAPQLEFDGYNRLNLSNITPTSTTLGVPDGTTRDLTTQSSVYIYETGTYTANVQTSDTFAYLSNVVNNVYYSDIQSPYFTDASTIVTDSNWSSSTGFQITSSGNALGASSTSTEYMAFDNIYTAANSWESTWLSGSNSMPAWVKIQYPQDVVIKSYTIVGRDATNRYYPTSWQLQGATAAAPSTYVNLETTSGNRTASSWAALAEVSHDVNSSNTAYRYFRLYVNSSNENDQVSINELKLYTTPLLGQNGFVPSLTHDGYKLSIQNITPVSTSLRLGSNTYEIGTATNIYVENTGDYSAEIGSAADFALTNTTVSGTLKTIEPGFASRYQGSMALTYDGKLYAWGMNDDGEAGVGTSSDITVPTLCTGITQGTVAKLLSSSDLTDNSRGEVSAIKTTDGKIYMAGKGDNNCIPGKTSDQTSFTDVTSYFGDQSLTANTVTMMSFTDRSGAALTETGNVWTWGTHDSTNKALGQASASSSSTPKQINFSSVTGTITKITCGVGHSLALDTSGDVWFWGKNTMNSTSWPSSITDEPQKVVDGKNIIGLASSHGTMYAWDATGKMWNAGNNWEGQIGDGTTTANSSGKTLTEVTYFSSNGITINKVYAGGYSVFADTSDGYYCWGNGSYGVFGNGSTGNITSGPAKWTNVTNIKKFMASTEHTTAITEDGKYYAWGRGTSYERGDNDTGDITYPKYISQLPNILAHSFEFDGYDKVFVNDPTIVGYRFGQVGHVLINIGGP